MNFRNNYVQVWILTVTQKGFSDYCNLDIKGGGEKLSYIQRDEFLLHSEWSTPAPLLYQRSYFCDPARTELFHGI